MKEPEFPSPAGVDSLPPEDPPRGEAVPEEAAVPAAEEAPSKPAPSDPAPAGDGLLAVFERMEAMASAGFAEILREFRDKLALDRFKEDQITKLHDELQAYRSDLVQRQVRQVLQGLIRLHDDLGKVVSSLRQRAPEELTPELFFRQIEGFRDDMELLLGQHGIEPFEAPGEEFDPRRQTALRTVPADDPALAGKIAERLRPGFEQGETLIQKERVAVYTAAAKS